MWSYMLDMNHFTQLTDIHVMRYSQNLYLTINIYNTKQVVIYLK
jgi:hypothetical protein